MKVPKIILTTIVIDFVFLVWFFLGNQYPSW